MLNVNLAAAADLAPEIIEDAMRDGFHLAIEDLIGKNDVPRPIVARVLTDLAEWYGGCRSSIRVPDRTAERDPASAADLRRRGLLDEARP